MPSKKDVDTSKKYNVNLKRDNNLSSDYQNYQEQLKKNDLDNQESINLKLKLSEQQIIEFLLCFQYKKIRTNVFESTTGNKSTLTIKPGETLHQLVRLYGHSRLLIGYEISVSEQVKQHEEPSRKKIFGLF